ncbi:TPA: hypothetical protein IAA82_05810 [Candidatus Galligastranaerophilus gallistercoris]|nr:hypothetical protein [Candidatus Galligastranaerophilus gallistercoris]
MGGFNPINIIVNTVSLFAVSKNAGTNAKAAGNTNVQNAQNNAQIQNSQNTFNSANSQSIYSSATTNRYSNEVLSSANQLLISTVEVEQRANYIKDLLNLPRDFEAFIKLIQSQNNPNTQMMKDLSRLLQNGKINLSELAVLLGDNSKEAVQKLMMTIMTVSKMGSNNVSQLKELMAMFSGASGQIDNSQTLKNVLMLYLPWLPLSIRNELNLDFDIDIFDKIQGGEEENNNGEVIRIMVQTANFGNILITLELNEKGEVDVYISANENFPEKEVLKMFKKENKQSNITSNVTVEKNKNNAKNDDNQKNVQITSSNYVSPKLILAAHSLIKIIIDVDNSEFIINEETEG